MSENFKYVLLTVLTVALVAIVTLNLIDLVDFGSTTDAAKVIVAAVALVGVVFTGVVTLFGILINKSVQDKAQRFNELQAERNTQLKEEAEARLKLESERDSAAMTQAALRNRMETVLRAVEVLGENNKDATSHQMVGALYALADLGELPLAIALVGELWSADAMSANAAAGILDIAFTGESDVLKREAAHVYSQNGAKIGQHGFHVWPFPGPGWRTDLPDSCRDFLVLAAAEWLISDLEEKIEGSPSGTPVLYDALNDPYGVLVGVAHSCLAAMVGRHEEKAMTIARGVRVTWSDIRTRLDEVADQAVFTHQSDRLRERVVKAMSEQPHS